MNVIPEAEEGEEQEAAAKKKTDSSLAPEAETKIATNLDVL